MTMADQPILVVDGLTKVYSTGLLNRREAFRLEADFAIDRPRIVGVMGPNGSGKTTLFEMITGSNRPTSGVIRCCGQNIHAVRYRERDRLAIHYHQSYQVRHFARRVPSFMLERAITDYPIVHLFDEPQFNTQDGYIGFMLEFFRTLYARERLVFLCVHPHEAYHVRIMREICHEFVFVNRGKISRAPDFETLVASDAVSQYLGKLAKVGT